MAGEFGYGMPELLQYLLPMIEGMSTKDGKAEYGLQASGVNNVQDLIKLLFDPQFAMLSGSYDPMLMGGGAQQAPPQPTEVWTQTDSFLQSGNPTIQAVADGIKSGQLNVLEASTMLEDAGFEATAAAHAADQMVGEQTANASAMAKWQQESDAAANAPRDDIFSQAGLPSPQEQYFAGKDESGVFQSNLGDVADPWVQQMLGQEGSKQGALDQFTKRNPDYVSPERRAGAADDLSKIDASLPTDGLTAANFAKWQSQVRDYYATTDPEGTSGKTDPRRRGWEQSDLKDGSITWDELIRQGQPDGKTSAPSDETKDLWNKLMEEQKTAAMWNSRGRSLAQRQVDSPSSREGDRLSREVLLSDRAAANGQGRAEGQAIALRASGQTPFQKALMARLLSVQGAGVLGG